MKVSQISYDNLTNNYIDKIIFNEIQDNGLYGDCIFVFGSPKASLYRVPKAVELYKNHRGRKILFSGGKFAEPFNDKVYEAIAMRDKAIELGVPKEDILIETMSQNTKENVLCSLIHLDRAFGLNNIKRILVVSAEFHMRRCILTLQAYMPNWIKISPCPAIYIKTQRNNWFLTHIGRKIVKNEAYKNITYIKEGSISDFNI